MADPILANGIRVQAIFQGGSNLPEDRFINTFAFNSDVASTTAALNAAVDKVRDFYTGTNAGGSIAQYMAGSTINESLSSFRAYYLGDPPYERVPYIEAYGGASFPSTAPLPAEVAVCGSYYAELNRPRSRGRLYIGPLNNTVVSATDGINDVRVSSSFTATLLAAMLKLAFNDTTPEWCILSLDVDGVSHVLKPVTHCWVDNAFDTQRRRGQKASIRVSGVANP